MDFSKSEKSYSESEVSEISVPDRAIRNLDADRFIGFRYTIGAAVVADHQSVSFSCLQTGYREIRSRSTAGENLFVTVRQCVGKFCTGCQKRRLLNFQSVPFAFAMI